MKALRQQVVQNDLFRRRLRFDTILGCWVTVRRDETAQNIAVQKGTAVGGQTFAYLETGMVE